MTREKVYFVLTFNPPLNTFLLSDASSGQMSPSSSGVSSLGEFHGQQSPSAWLPASRDAKIIQIFPC